MLILRTLPTNSSQWSITCNRSSLVSTVAPKKPFMIKLEKKRTIFKDWWLLIWQGINKLKALMTVRVMEDLQKRAVLWEVFLILKVVINIKVIRELLMIQRMRNSSNIVILCRECKDIRWALSKMISARVQFLKRREAQRPTFLSTQLTRNLAWLRWLKEIGMKIRITPSWTK